VRCGSIRLMYITDRRATAMIREERVECWSGGENRMIFERDVRLSWASPRCMMYVVYSTSHCLIAQFVWFVFLEFA